MWRLWICCTQKQRQEKNKKGGLRKTQSIRGAPIKLDDIDSGSERKEQSPEDHKQSIEMRGAPTVLDDILNE